MFKRDKAHENSLPDFLGTHSIIDDRMDKFEINLSECSKASDERNNAIAKKIVALMQSDGFTYREALQVPAFLKAYLSIEFQNHVLDSLIQSFSCGSEQSDQRDHDSNN